MRRPSSPRLTLLLPLVSLALVASCGAGAPDDDGTPDAGGRDRLSAETLYDDISTKTLAADLLPFTPAHELWSDGAKKRRFLRLPEGAVIDTSDMDHWDFPPGTQVWKEFATPEGKLLETRLLERTGTGVDDWAMGSFLWTEDQTDAVFTPEGAEDVLGTEHDVPDAQSCWSCHRYGQGGTVNGFSAVQLSKEGDAPTLDSLIADGLLSDPPDVHHPTPGTTTEAAALGYLHANCGHCHHPNGPAWPLCNGLVLRLYVDEATAEETALYESTVGEALTRWAVEGFLRIDPGSPETSAVVYRMTQRGTTDQMPPIATEVVHADGVARVSAWIEDLN